MYFASTKEQAPSIKHQVCTLLPPSTKQQFVTIDQQWLSTCTWLPPCTKYLWSDLWTLIRRGLFIFTCYLHSRPSSTKYKVPEVRFVTVDEQWVVNVLRNHHWLFQRHLVGIDQYSCWYFSWHLYLHLFVLEFELISVFVLSLLYLYWYLYLNWPMWMMIIDLVRMVDNEYSPATGWGHWFNNPSTCKIIFPYQVQSKTLFTRSNYGNVKFCSAVKSIISLLGFVSTTFRPC